MVASRGLSRANYSEFLALQHILGGSAQAACRQQVGRMCQGAMALKAPALYTMLQLVPSMQSQPT